LSSVGADAEINKYHMQAGIIGYQVSGLNILMQNPGIVQIFKTCDHRRNDKAPELVFRKPVSAGQHLGKRRIVVKRKDGILMSLIFSEADNGSHAGTLEMPELLNHFRLYGMLPAVVFQDKVLPGILPPAGTKIDVGFSGRYLPSAVNMKVAQGNAGDVRSRGILRIGSGAFQLFSNRGIDLSFRHKYSGAVY
jgi:hypothetical protein